MVSSRQVSLPRCLAVAAGVSVGYGVLVAWMLPVATAGTAAGFDEVLVRLCAGTALVAAGWLWLATVTTVLGALRGPSAPVRGVPAPLRRAVLATCGAALTSGLIAAGPADATPGHQHEDRVASAASVVAGLALPDRATAPAPSVRRFAVVAPGDTLWAIAARGLGSGAPDAEVEAAWRRIYELNRAEIGPDPDLIRPAQRLEVLP